ncbi:hypothetical protein FDECE_11628 [Fusarium decemcellulare]|nr:hypothetical protein FDECE_11628 [Fusarium decemcellulare]
MPITISVSTMAGALTTARLPFLIGIVMAFAVAWSVPLLSRRYHLSKIPIAALEVGGEEKRRLVYMKTARNIYEEGYRRFKNGVFRISGTNKSTNIVVHPRYLPELKDLPEGVLDYYTAIGESLFTRYTKFRADRPIVPHVIKADLTPAIHRLAPLIADEVSLAFLDEFPTCKDFTKINISSKLYRIISKVSGHVFVGPDICRTEKYVNIAVNYTVVRTAAQRAIAAIPPWQRVFRAKSLPEVRRLTLLTKEAHDFLRPLIVERREASKHAEYQKPDDLLQWIIDDGQKRFGRQDTEELTSIQLALTSAAIHTTTMVATNAFYSIASMPDIVPELRAELRDVLAEHGTFTTRALAKLRKLDSFLRENMRCNSLGWTAFPRRVKTTFTLSDGQVIPAGYNIEIPAYALSHDPGVIPDPDKFDAFRFYHAGPQTTNDLVSVSPTNMNFGYGRHACPGRFFAASELKMILSTALLGYDIRLADGVTERYQNMDFAGLSFPDPNKTLLFKSMS